MATMEKGMKKSKIDLLFDVIKDPDRKPLLTMTSELFTLLFYHKSLPMHYFSRYLFKKGQTNIKDYFPDDFLYYKLKPKYNEHTVRVVVENKLYFNFFYSQFNIRLPKILLYNHRKMFVKNNVNFEVNSAAEFKIQLEAIFDQNPSYDSLFIKKTYGSYGGDRVYKIFRHQLSSDVKMIEALYFEVIKTGFLIQETVKQHPEMNKLNPSCVNTIRIDTFIDKEGNVEIMSAFLRMSTTNLHVDNITSGGFRVGVDLQSGRLKKYAYSGFGSVGTLVLTEHPVTKTVFENFSIPYFEEAKEMLLKTASLMPGLRLVGWDMAISETGPVLIEGNADYIIAGNDFMDGGYRRNATFRKVLDEAGYLKK